ncbi:MAG: mevalonate kinase [Candidatus Hodarchaeales archaeon]
MGFGRGFGKAILFNEHFVVYGIPGIVSAIGLSTIANTKRHNEKSGIIIDDQRIATEGYKEGYIKAMDESISRMCEVMNLDRENTNVKTTLSGDLYAAGGIGASAAACVSIARSLNDYFKFQYNDDKINEIAFEGEKAYAGTPSGIDNTASTFGGLIEYELKDDQVVMNRLSIKKPIDIVMGSTGIIVHTKEIVTGVRVRKERNPKKFDELFNQARALIPRAKKELRDYNLEALGNLMNEANKLLEAIGISSPQLEKLISIARNNGAWGAKITGSGIGGFMLALTPSKTLQEKVALAIEKEGFHALRTTIG